MRDVCHRYVGRARFTGEDLACQYKVRQETRDVGDSAKVVAPCQCRGLRLRVYLDYGYVVRGAAGRHRRCRGVGRGRSGYWLALHDNGLSRTEPRTHIRHDEMGMHVVHTLMQSPYRDRIWNHRVACNVKDVTGWIPAHYLPPAYGVFGFEEYRHPAAKIPINQTDQLPLNGQYIAGLHGLYVERLVLDPDEATLKMLLLHAVGISRLEERICPVKAQCARYQHYTEAHHD